MLTHADQSAQIADTEQRGPMFPRGPKQLLGFIYAMEGEIARKKSWHAKIMEIRELMDCGYVHPFPLHQINLSGLEPILINAECAGLRQQIEDLLGESIERAVVWAKFGKDELERTEWACDVLSKGLQAHLTRGWRKAQRSRSYCTDIIRSITCAGALYEQHYSVMKIARRHQVGQSLVSKDCTDAKRYLGGITASAYKKIEEKFADGAVLP